MFRHSSTSVNCTDFGDRVIDRGLSGHNPCVILFVRYKLFYILCDLICLNLSKERKSRGPLDTTGLHVPFRSSLPDNIVKGLYNLVSRKKYRDCICDDFFG